FGYPHGVVDFRIRDLTADDPAAVAQAAAILQDAFRKHWPEAWPTPQEATQAVIEMLAPDRIARVAVTQFGEVVGFIGGIPEYDGNVWELHPLAVRPDLQGRGIGRALVADFEGLVADRGGLTIVLGSDDEDGMTSLAGADLYDGLWDRIKTIRNIKGHPFGFYLRLGYVITGVVPDANGRGKPDILMGKRVG
ncbi:MAG TPA: GNAT family N-acetyltransferase, partial [Thermoflexales bacterium]|nr:GNAT family N-acetyltransferase [Thermoflexales bacterium]